MFDSLIKSGKLESAFIESDKHRLANNAFTKRGWAHAMTKFGVAEQLLGPGFS